MNMHVSKARVDWLQMQVASGRFASIEEALDAAVAALQAELEFEDAWAKPYLDEALQSVDRGEATPWTKGEALKQLQARHRELADGPDR